MSLGTLLQQRADLWRGGDITAHGASPATPTGHPQLDEQLQGGWPVGALTELLLPRHGIGELQLLMPAMARLSAAGRWLSWITPPYLPYAPALAAAQVDLARLLLVHAAQPRHALWAMEQALRSGTCGMVLGWCDQADMRTLRRLQLAAEHGAATAVLFRSPQAAQQSSPAALRLRLEPTAGGLNIHILKRRGGWNHQPVPLQRSYAVA